MGKTIGKQFDRPKDLVTPDPKEFEKVSGMSDKARTERIDDWLGQFKDVKSQAIIDSNTKKGNQRGGRS